MFLYTFFKTCQGFVILKRGVHFYWFRIVEWSNCQLRKNESPQWKFVWSLRGHTRMRNGGNFGPFSNFEIWVGSIFCTIKIQYFWHRGASLKITIWIDTPQSCQKMALCNHEVLVWETRSSNITALRVENERNTKILKNAKFTKRYSSKLVRLPCIYCFIRK